MLGWQSVSLRAVSRQLAESALRNLSEKRAAVEFPSRVISRIWGLVALALGLAVLFGWALDLDALKSVLPGMVAMQPWAATAIALAGGALLAATAPGRIAVVVSTALAGTVVIFGLQTLLQYATGLDLGTDWWFFPEAVSNQPGHPHPGRVAEATSIAFALLGTMLLLAGVERAWARGVFSTIGTVGLILMAAPLAGYLIGAGTLKSVAFFTPIALHTALGLVVLFLGALALRPDTGWMALLSRDTPGATSALLVLPVAVAAPVLLAWVVNSGRNAGLYGPEFQVGLGTLVTTALLGTALLWNAARLDRLHRARLAAAEARLAQSQFLAAISHDLRQPVQALMLFTSALAAKITGAPASALLDDIRGSVEALDLLLDALLDVSSLNSGNIIPHETTFSLATLIERLVAEFEPQASQKEIGFRVVPSSAIVRTDPTLLYRILQNFLSNAVRYTSQGGILIGCRRCGRKLRIEVVDSGIGIPTHLQQEVFKEFFQIGNPERDRTQGLGLGLAIVQRLSRLLRCPVTVRSQEGRGAAFGVEVTLVGFNKTINIVPLRRSPLVQPVTGKGVVFVIDDEPSVLKGLRLVIEDWGYTVLTARTELEAIGILNGRKQAPDIIIADYQLRSICNGAQVVAHIRQTFGAPVPCILITGDAAPERIREANDHGFTLLHKPVQPAELRAAITTNLRARVRGPVSAA